MDQQQRANAHNKAHSAKEAKMAKKNTQKQEAPKANTKEEKAAARKAAQEAAKAERAARKAERDAKNAERKAKLEAEKAERKANRKPTRAATFKAMVTEKPRTKKELVAEMVSRYGGSENEAAFQVDNMVRLLLEFGYASYNSEKQLVLEVQPKG